MLERQVGQQSDNIIKGQAILSELMVRVAIANTLNQEQISALQIELTGLKQINGDLTQNIKKLEGINQNIEITLKETTSERDSWKLASERNLGELKTAKESFKDKLGELNASLEDYIKLFNEGEEEINKLKTNGSPVQHERISTLEKSFYRIQGKYNALKLEKREWKAEKSNYELKLQTAAGKLEACESELNEITTELIPIFEKNPVLKEKINDLQKSNLLKKLEPVLQQIKTFAVNNNYEDHLKLKDLQLEISDIQEKIDKILIESQKTFEIAAPFMKDDANFITLGERIEKSLESLVYCKQLQELIELLDQTVISWASLYEICFKNLQSEESKEVLAYSVIKDKLGKELSEKLDSLPLNSSFLFELLCIIKAQSEQILLEVLLDQEDEEKMLNDLELVNNDLTTFTQLRLDSNLHRN